MSQLQNWLIKNHEPESDKSSPILSKIPSISEAKNRMSASITVRLQW